MTSRALVTINVSTAAALQVCSLGKYDKLMRPTFASNSVSCIGGIHIPSVASAKQRYYSVKTFFRMASVWCELFPASTDYVHASKSQRRQLYTVDPLCPLLQLLGTLLSGPTLCFEYS